MVNTNPRFSSITRMVLVAGTCACGAMLSGCVESSEDDVTARDIKDQAAQTMETTREFAQDQIESYKESFQERMNVINTQIDMLETHAATLTGDAKDEVESVINDLESSRDSFMERVQNAQADSQDAWDDIKSGLDSAWDDLKSSAEDAAERFGG